MATSERLQIQKIREDIVNEEEYALVSFEDEASYSFVDMARIQEKDATYNQTVNIMWGKGRTARPYPAKLLFAGSKDECEKESLDLSFGAQTETSSTVEGYEKMTSSRTVKRKGAPEESLSSKKAKEGKKGSDLHEGEEDPVYELDRLNKVLDEGNCKRKEPVQRSSIVPRSLSDTDLSYLVERLDAIERKVDQLLKAKNTAASSSTTTSLSQTPSPILFKGKKSSNEVSDDEDNISDLVYNGIDLLNLKAPPKEPTRYATKVVGVLFTKEELLNGMVPPVNEKYGRTALDNEKILLLKKCITAKYSEPVLNKMWSDIRRAVNQKCNDLRKKQPQPTTAAEDDLSFR